MSFILDALRKSETERQQHGKAEFATVPTSSGSATVPRWLWFVGLLLFINLAVLVSLLMRSNADPALEPLVENVEIAGAVEATETAAPDFQEQIAVAQQSRPQRQEAVDTRPDVKREQQIRPVLISQDPGSVPASSLYPTLQEVRASGANNLPELHLDIHVYSETPEERFVFINMVKHREGSQLPEGPVVAEITPDGVVLGHRGNFVLLPRD